jgi:aminomethyltransferase
MSCVEPLDRVFLAIQGPEAAADLLAGAGIDLGTAFVFMNGFEPKDRLVHEPVGLYRRGRLRDRRAGTRTARELCCAKLLADERVHVDRPRRARFSLRLEAGLCLHGRTSTPADRPGESGLHSHGRFPRHFA